MHKPNEQPGLADAATTLTGYYSIVKRKSKKVLAITLGASVLALIYSLLLPNIYTAKAMLVPVQESTASMSSLMMSQLGGIAGLAGTALGGPTQSDLFVTMLKSETIKDTIIDRFQLSKVYKAKYRETMYQTLDKNSSIGAGKKDGVIVISFNDKDPKRAADIANAYVDELGKLAVKLNVTGAGKNKAFLEERLAKAKADLSHAEDALRQFQAKNKAIDVPGQAKATIESIAKLRAELAAQEVKLATLRRQFTDSSQEVKTANATVANLKTQLAHFENGRNENSLSGLGSFPTVGKEYLGLMREFKTQEALVELLTKQHELAQYTESKDIAPFNVIQNARIPERKSKPHRLLIVLTVTFYAFILSTIGIIITEKLRKPST